MYTKGLLIFKNDSNPIYYSDDTVLIIKHIQWQILYYMANIIIRYILSWLNIYNMTIITFLELNKYRFNIKKKPC